MNPVDALQQYSTLRDAIFTEREQLLTRLRAIDEALGSLTFRGKDSYYGPRASGSRPRNEMTLKEAVLKVIDGKALTKHQVLDAVLALGYKFSTDDPLNSLGVVLYGTKPRFNRNRGLFSHQ